ncbi:MAG TPA: DUF2007 domain-containing protein [Candidatus Eisenbacteria bacterium]|nr:DUF2007 domain-containing protein [Candidatus Eisenbacteria bacterium]
MTNNLTLVFTGKQMEVEMAQGLLEDNEIKSLIQSEHGAGFTMQAGKMFENYYLYVEEKDAQEALALCDAFCTRD